MAADPDFIAFRDVLFDALAGAIPAAGDADVSTLLRRLSVEAGREAPAHPATTPLLARLYETGATSTLEQAVEAARARFPTASAFREAIYTARCLARDCQATLDMLAALGYLADAQLPATASYASLAVDRAAVLDTLSMETLWRQPARLAGLLNLAQLWKQEYFKHYAPAHAAYHAALSGAVEQLEAARPARDALSRLNALRRLGPAAGITPLEQYDAFDRLFPCPAGDTALARALAAAPSCGECGFRLGDAPPVAEMRRVAAAIERGLATQQARLARRVVGLLLARPATGPEARLRRFVEVVQASDLGGLARIIDDEVIAFLDDLLAGPGSEGSVLGRLARSFPAVTSSNIDAVVEEFGRLLADEVAREGIVRLRNPGHADR